VKQAMDDYSLFEYCLTQLEAGKDLDSILAQFPDKADKLRPLLVAALKARQRGIPMRIPASAQVDSRTRFLAEAAHIRESNHRKTLPRLRFAAMAALIVVVLLAGLIGTGLTSAQAIPGQPLYSVKRTVEQAQLALTTDQAARLKLEEEFDLRRVSEAEKLAETNYSGSIKLAGPLVASGDKKWSVGGVQLSLDDDQEALAESLIGSYIEVEGLVSAGDGLAVEQMELRLFNISGTIEAIDGAEWRVNGVIVMIMETTKISGKPAVGKKVEMTALHNASENYLALSVKVKGRNSNQDTGEGNNAGNITPLPGGIDQDEEEIQSTMVKSPEAEITQTPKRDEDHQEDKTPTPQPDEDDGEDRTPTPD